MYGPANPIVLYNKLLLFPCLLGSSLLEITLDNPIVLYNKLKQITNIIGIPLPCFSVTNMFDGNLNFLCLIFIDKCEDCMLVIPFQ